MIRILDGVLDAATLAEAALSWPDASWPHWLGYDSPLESKRTCRDWEAIPGPCRRLLAELAAWAAREHPGLVPDTSLYGAGMSDMRWGDFLTLHRDHDRHPHLGLTRRLNAVLFLPPAWRRNWGGELEVWDRDRAGPSVRVMPLPGRIVLFDPASPHAVAPVAGPEARRTLSVYCYGPPWMPAADSERPRAQFVPAAGEAEDPGRDRLRAERAAMGERREEE